MKIRHSLLSLFLFVAVMSCPTWAQENASSEGTLAISQSPSLSGYRYQPMTFSQQQARFEAEQRMYRMEWNNWIGHAPLRPTLNSNTIYGGSYYQSFYVPQRGTFISTGHRRWYW